MKTSLIFLFVLWSQTTFADAVNKPISTERGFERLIVDVAASKANVRIGLNGAAIDGHILGIEEHIITVESKGKFVYIPVGAVTHIAQL